MLRMEDARVGERSGRYRAKIRRYELSFAQMRKAAPRQPNRLEVQIGVVAAFLAAMAAAGGARGADIRGCLWCAGPIRRRGGGSRNLGHHLCQVGGESLAPRGRDRRQRAITARQLDIAPSHHRVTVGFECDFGNATVTRMSQKRVYARLRRAMATPGTAPAYRCAHAGYDPSATHPTKSERPRGEPRPLDGGGGAGSPPQPCGERRAAKAARRIGHML